MIYPYQFCVMFVCVRLNVQKRIRHPKSQLFKFQVGQKIFTLKAFSLEFECSDMSKDLPEDVELERRDGLMITLKNRETWR
jgi:hypothetical protein